MIENDQEHQQNVIIQASSEFQSKVVGTTTTVEEQKDDHLCLPLLEDILSIKL